MKQIVVTGRGSLTALGMDYPAFAERLMRGECAIAPITRFDASALQIQVAAQIPGYQEQDWFDEGALSQLDRFAQYGMLAAQQAIREAALPLQDEQFARRTAILLGTGCGGQETQEQGYHRLYVQGAKRFHPFTVPKLIHSSVASQISIAHKVTGPVFTTSSACSSAGHAIAMSVLLLRSGMVDAAITGGTEACITFATVRAWEGLRVMAKSLCRPFCKQRDGMVLGEGAAVLVLETRESAEARGAAIFAELAGFGMSSDAHNPVQAHVDGPVAAMQAALQDAGLSAEQIDYINAHGTGTHLNDLVETQAIQQVFGGHARTVAVSSSKSMHGHTLGAASAVESLACLAALQEQKIPPTVNFLDADPQCDLNLVTNQARSQPLSAVMNNSFAFGGLNTSLIFKAAST
ncbi:beta-ketoacyl-[acyl-carrier-protein] synthase family protein [Candidatus Magnetaquicoccus inordinatus]|uniref:beta-ketoacyl-[acyl-carrier-protein] synthase family protein n=1 Tax=Candidatus Magnetaquicoccus inordinatus TaxID=2496818 RepID=UPI00102BE9C1|nr:beta-ketoacyl-[acyl-carrier-protein] synthase family protein [Candidatus Magnetaquicoccus inordinatus]